MNIAAKIVPESQRTILTANLFGVYFPLQLEPFVFAMTSKLSDDYSGGYWNFYTLSNGGFYMAPDSAALFQVVSENGYEGFMSADALGTAACMYAYSHLSFGGGTFAETCAEHYHCLREYIFGHDEATMIFRVID